MKRVSIMHGDSAANADELQRQLETRFTDRTIERGEIGSVLGVHGGPGVIGASVLLSRSA